jgi:hypothetical protein
MPCRALKSVITVIVMALFVMVVPSPMPPVVMLAMTVPTVVAIPIPIARPVHDLRFLINHRRSLINNRRGWRIDRPGDAQINTDVCAR